MFAPGSGVHELVFDLVTKAVQLFGAQKELLLGQLEQACFVAWAVEAGESTDAFGAFLRHALNAVCVRAVRRRYHPHD